MHTNYAEGFFSSESTLCKDALAIQPLTWTGSIPGIYKVLCRICDACFPGRSLLVVTSTRLSTSKATRKPAFYELRHTPFLLGETAGIGTCPSFPNGKKHVQSKSNKAICADHSIPRPKLPRKRVAACSLPSEKVTHFLVQQAKKTWAGLPSQQMHSSPNFVGQGSTQASLNREGA